MLERALSILLFAAAVSTSLAFGSAIAGAGRNAASPQHHRAMTKTTTVCFGRYLIDIPAEAEFSIGNAESDSINIKHRIPPVDEQAFRDELAEHEKGLREAKHDFEGSLLRSISRINGQTQLVFASRTDARDRRTTRLETFLMRPSYRLSYVAADEDIREITDLIAHLSLRIKTRGDSLPRSTGACITDGLIDYVPVYNERFTAGAFHDSPAWVISFTTETTGPTGTDKDLHSRVDRAIEMAGPAGATIRKLRRGFVTVDGRKGREYLGIYPADRDGPTESFDAKLEVEGNGTPQQPNIKVQMETRWPKRRDPSDPTRYLTQQEAMALWDAVIKTVRMRPGAF